MEEKGEREAYSSQGQASSESKGRTKGAVSGHQLLFCPHSPAVSSPFPDPGSSHLPPSVFSGEQSIPLLSFPASHPSFHLASSPPVGLLSKTSRILRMESFIVAVTLNTWKLTHF